MNYNIFLKKRGQLVLKPAIEILVAVAILLLFIYVGRVYGTEEIFEKARITKNTALSISTLSSLPDNSQIFFSKGLSKYTMNIQSNSVKLTKTANDTLPTEYKFILTTDQSLIVKFEKPGILAIAKSGNEIELKIEGSSKLNKLVCPSITTKKISKIIFTPQLIQGNDYPFTNLLKSVIDNADVQDNIKEIPDALIEITEIDKSNTLQIEITPNLESRRLACLIINDLLDKNLELQTIILPSDKQLLSNQKIGLSIGIWDEIQDTFLLAVEKAFKEYHNV